MALRFAFDDLKRVLLTDRQFHAYVAIMWMVVVGLALAVELLS